MMEQLLIAYLVFGMLWFGGFLIGYSNCAKDNDSDKRLMARMLLLTPVWPVIVLAHLARSIYRMWQAADWKNL